jgi:hypothetical protein
MFMMLILINMHDNVIRKSSSHVVTGLYLTVKVHIYTRGGGGVIWHMRSVIGVQMWGD